MSTTISAVLRGSMFSWTCAVPRRSMHCSTAQSAILIVCIGFSRVGSGSERIAQTERSSAQLRAEIPLRVELLRGAAERFGSLAALAGEELPRARLGFQLV